MNKEEIEQLKETEKKKDELPCPHCGGIQVEDRNCIAGYTQFRCTHCGYVEPFKDKLARATGAPAWITRLIWG